jgi:hypothetical protein
VRFACLLLGLGCGDNLTTPDDPTFQFHATAGWSSGSTPTVVSVAIDGHPISDGTEYTIDVRYSSYARALALFRPSQVVITTATATQTFPLELGHCRYVPNLDGAITFESDHFYAVRAQPDAAVDFVADCGQCKTADGRGQGWCTRTATDRPLPDLGHDGTVYSRSR